MAEIALDHVSKRYADGSLAVSDVNLTVGDGEFVILVGPSGCGKSTTLNMIAGLEDISEGELRIAGERVNDKAPKDRDIAMVFQSYALYPHMSVRQNIAFPLTLRKMSKAEINTKVEDAARILDLTSFLDRKPANLSGGQRQRVAMGRAIVRSPKAFLMDEPLSNLDAKLRVQMRTEIAGLQHRLRTTTVYVTHDQTEAMTLGDRVVVLRDGQVQQVGTPQELYNRPRNLFVAGFIGSPAMNFIPGQLGQYGIHTQIGEIRLPQYGHITQNAMQIHSSGQVLVGIRPEHFEDPALVDPAVRQNGIIVSAHIDMLESMGSDNYAYFSLGAPEASAGQALSELAAAAGTDIGVDRMVARLSADSQITRGMPAHVFVDTRKVAVFDQATGTNLGL